MSADFDVMAYALYAMCLVWSFYVFLDVALNSCSGNIHNIVFGSCPAFHNGLLC